jgi:predicted MPP superfamily phosphohydrolase
MNLYACWRICDLPIVRQRAHRRLVTGVLVFLASSFLLARLSNNQFWPARTLEFVGVTWIGILFLVCVCFLLADLITVFGLAFRGLAPTIRILALCTAGLLSIIAVVQGHRPPEIRSYDLHLKNLPASMDKTVLVAASDLHLVSLLGETWAHARVQQMQALHPDIVILCGDVIEGDDPSDRTLLLELADLKAPLGVWAVNGNHESHGDPVRSPDIFEQAGIRLLRNEWAEVRPGFVVAGVDDLTHARRQGRDPHAIVVRALSGVPRGAATVFVSHSPLETESAESAGAALMLSGHTHDGQVWPFSYIVRELYPYMSGQYSIGSMKLIVCRGTGTWGPRMRLWRRSELVKITLRAES